MPAEATPEIIAETPLADYTPTGSYVAEREAPQEPATEDTPPPEEPKEPEKEAAKEDSKDTKDETDPVEDYRKRIASIARKDRELSRKAKELEDNVRQFAQWQQQEMLELQSYKAAREAAKRGDNIGLLQSLGADTSALYSDMTALAIDGKLDISKLSQPKQDEAYKQIAEELAATRAEMEEIKQYHNSLENQQAIHNAYNFIKSNQSKYPKLAELDNGTVLWKAVNQAYAEDPTITVEQVARETETQLREESKSNVEFWTRVNSAGEELEAPNESVAEKPKQIAKTITNKANAAQMPRNLQDRLKGVRDLQEKARIMRAYYVAQGE